MQFAAPMRVVALHLDNARLAGGRDHRVLDVFRQCADRNPDLAGGEPAFEVEPNQATLTEAENSQLPASQSKYNRSSQIGRCRNPNHSGTTWLGISQQSMNAEMKVPILGAPCKTSASNLNPLASFRAASTNAILKVASKRADNGLKTIVAPVILMRPGAPPARRAGRRPG